MKVFRSILLLIGMLAAWQASAADLLGGKLTIVSPDGEMAFELPKTGFAVQDFTSYGAAPTLVVKKFEVGVSGDFANITLMAALYKQNSSPSDHWMAFPLTDMHNGTWAIDINQDLVEVIQDPGNFALEVYVKATDAGGNELLLNNGGSNYIVKFALGSSDTGGVHWLTTGTAEIILYTGGYPEYRYNGDGTRDNEEQPGSVDMLGVNFWSIYYDLDEGTEIVDASLQYKIYADGQDPETVHWNTIESNELNHLVSARKNTYRSSMNEQRLISRGLEPGNYTLSVHYQLIDSEGKYHLFGKNNDNFLFHFSVNEPPEPDILGISMSVTPTPGETQYLWFEKGDEEYTTIDLTDQPAIKSLTVDEVFIFAEGNFNWVNLEYLVLNSTGAALYMDNIWTTLDDFGNWSIEEPTEILRPDLLQDGVYSIRFGAVGMIDGVEEGSGDGYYYLDNDGEGYVVTFNYGSGDTPATPGDVSGDGKVDVDDINKLVSMLLGKIDTTDAADVNGDGKVDVDDINMVINIMLGK